MRVEICAGPAVIPFDEEIVRAKARRTETLRSLLGDRLTACLVFVPTPADDAEAALPSLSRCCAASTELFFDDLPDQWDRLCATGPFRPGHVAVTRHSNLNGVHLVLHAVYDSGAAAGAPLTPPAETLARVFAMLPAWHVHTLLADFADVPASHLLDTTRALVTAMAHHELRQADLEEQRPLMALMTATSPPIGVPTVPLRLRLHVPGDWHRRVTDGLTDLRVTR